MADLLLVNRELDVAVALLKNRLDHHLVEKLDDGDFADNLLAYLRNRSTPQLLFSPDNVTHILERCRALDPQEYAWQKRIADEAVAGRVYAASNPHCDRFVELDRKTFDFSHFNHWDKEALHGLNRHRWYKALAQFYWENQCENYFVALMNEWDFYAEKVSPPDELLHEAIHSIGPNGMVPPYGELDVYIRLTNWWWAYWLILHASQMTPKRNVVLLARCLRLFDRVAARGVSRMQEHNFTSMQMESLYFWASSLPEVTGMDVWKHTSRNCLESSLARAIAEDGSHWEQSIGYHSGCISWYGTSVLLARRNGQNFADEYVKRLLSMGKYLDAVITPDGHLPLLSDSGRSKGWRHSLALIKCIFSDDHFDHAPRPTYESLWVSDGREWEPAPCRRPAPTVRVFAQAGIAVARNTDLKANAMLIFDNGPNHAGHAHQDNLNIHYEAFGLPVLVDPGRWVYSPGQDRAWVLSAIAHNTIYIEDKPIEPQTHTPAIFQRIASTDDPRVGPIEHTSENGIVRLDTLFKGYIDDSQARVHRTVLFPIQGQPWLAVLDRFESDQPHTWANTWLVPADQPVRKGGGSYMASLAGGLRLGFAAASSEPLEWRDDSKFWCPIYAQKSPARWTRFSSHAQCGQRAFLFVPSTVEEGDESARLLPRIIFNNHQVELMIDDKPITKPLKV